MGQIDHYSLLVYVWPGFHPDTEILAYIQCTEWLLVYRPPDTDTAVGQTDHYSLLVYLWPGHHPASEILAYIQYREWLLVYRPPNTDTAVGQIDQQTRLVYGMPLPCHRNLSSHFQAKNGDGLSY